MTHETLVVGSSEKLSTGIETENSGNKTDTETLYKLSLLSSKLSRNSSLLLSSTTSMLESQGYKISFKILFVSICDIIKTLIPSSAMHQHEEGDSTSNGNIGNESLSMYHENGSKNIHENELVVESFQLLTNLISCDHLPYEIIKIIFPLIESILQKIITSSQSGSQIITDHKESQESKTKKTFLLKLITSFYAKLHTTQPHIVLHHMDHSQIFVIIQRLACHDSRPKVRKTSQSCIKIITSTELALPPPLLIHPLTSASLSYPISLLIEQSQNTAVILDVMGYLITIVPTLHPSSIVASKLFQMIQVIIDLLKDNRNMIAKEGHVLVCWAFKTITCIVTKLTFPFQVSTIEEQQQVSTSTMLESLDMDINIMTPLITFLLLKTTEPSPLSLSYAPYLETLSSLPPNPQAHLVTHCVSTILIKSTVENIPMALMTTIKTIENLSREQLEDEQVVRFLEGGFSLATRDTWGAILQVYEAWFACYHQVNSNGALDGESKWRRLVKVLFRVRDGDEYAKGFPFKRELEQTMAVMVRYLGIEAVLSVSPLNLLEAGGVKRPYLVSEKGALRMGLKGGVSKLNGFVSVLYPLACGLWLKSEGYSKEGKGMESQVYARLAEQVFGMMVGFMQTLDVIGQLEGDMGDIFAAMVGGILVGEIVIPGADQVLVVGVVVKSLNCLLQESGTQSIEGSQGHGSSGPSQTWADKYATKFMAALCNRFMTTQDAGLQAITTTCIKLFRDKCPLAQTDEYVGMAAKQFLTTLDGICLDLVEMLLSPTRQLQVDIATSLYAVLSEELTGQLRKKAYKCLVGLLETKGVWDSAVRADQVWEMLMQDKVVALGGGSKSRLLAIQAVVTQFADTERPNKALRGNVMQEEKECWIFKVIPECLAEVMLATKESNEKTRMAGFDCLLCFARVMIEYEQLHEFVIMVIAGLGGEGPQMQSAAISTIGRLLYEYHAQLQPDVIDEIFQTILVAMSIQSREVVKSALGFIKVAICCLDRVTIARHLSGIIASMLKHARQQKSQFRAKARHIFERLIRNHGGDLVESFFPEVDRRLISNIRKRREAAKRKDNKSSSTMDDTKGGEEAKKPFETVFNDSESELGSDIEADDRYIPSEYRSETNSKRIKKGDSRLNAVIREDSGDGVVDFLDQDDMAQITHAGALKRKKGKSPKAHFATNSQGRMVVNEEIRDADSKDDSDGGQDMEVDQQDYYKQALGSEVAFTRSADGRRVKVIKKNSELSHLSTQTFENGAADTEIGNRWSGGAKKKEKEEGPDYEKMLGRQYRAKKAKGDVKKVGMADPYAYIPLSGKIVGNMKKSAKLDGTLKDVLKAAQSGKALKTKSKVGKKVGKSIVKGNKKHRVNN